MRRLHFAAPCKYIYGFMLHFRVSMLLRPISGSVGDAVSVSSLSHLPDHSPEFNPPKGLI